MAIVTGTLTDFSLDPLTPYMPLIVFKPSTAAVGVTLMSARPIKVLPNSSGEFSVDLEPTDGLISGNGKPVFYRITLEWLNPDGGYIGKDFPDWELYVPAAGGDFAGLVNGPVMSGLVWIGPTAPTNPDLYTGWIDTTAGDIYEWEL